MSLISEDLDETDTVADRLEAEIRTAMSRLPKRDTCRGWLTARARTDGIDWLDCLFDEWALLVWGPAPWRG